MPVQMDHRRTLRARGKSSRATAVPLDHLLLEATSASSIVALILSRSVAILSMPALVAPRCIFAPSSVSRVHFSFFFALSSSVLVVPRSIFEEFNSFLESSSFVLSALIS